MLSHAFSKKNRIELYRISKNCETFFDDTIPEIVSCVQNLVRSTPRMVIPSAQCSRSNLISVRKPLIRHILTVITDNGQRARQRLKRTYQVHSSSSQKVQFRIYCCALLTASVLSWFLLSKNLISQQNLVS